MYPDWPRSDADLVPLPRCDGPKVSAFDFGGAQNIEFLQELGEGLHGHVFRVRINNQIYALKLFRFLDYTDWTTPWDEHQLLDRDIMRVYYDFWEPFNCELRAFGRLQEAGHEDLAIKCHGYLLLDQAHEDKMRLKFPGISFLRNGHEEIPGDELEDPEEDCRGYFRGRDGRRPPIRGIVKALGQEVNESAMTSKDFKKLRQNICRLHRLGIMSLDLQVGFNQIFDKMQMGDFSWAVTVPHPVTSQELNPALTATMKRLMEIETFGRVSGDLFEFDDMVQHRNETYGDQDGVITVRAFPEGNRCSRIQRLRSKRLVVHTSYDPRKYAWRIKRRGEKPRTLAGMSDTWRLDCLGDEKLAARLSECTALNDKLGWRFENGRLFPY
ncbi:hypothetical protein RB596_007382 [Gaeumannomyces avenae]